jgi:hypothetical protein
MESRIAWTQLAAIREFAARRPANPAGRGGGGPAIFKETTRVSMDVIAAILRSGGPLM